MTDCKYFVKVYHYHTLCTLLLSLTCLFQFSIRIELNIFIIEAFVLNSPLQLRTLPDALYYVLRAGPPPITITRLKKD